MVNLANARARAAAAGPIGGYGTRSEQALNPIREESPHAQCPQETEEITILPIHGEESFFDCEVARNRKTLTT